MRRTLSQIESTVKRQIKETDQILHLACSLVLKERYFWIYTLYKAGWKKIQLAKLTGYTRQRISQIILQIQRFNGKPPSKVLKLESSELSKQTKTKGGEKSIKKTG